MRRLAIAAIAAGMLSACAGKPPPAIVAHAAPLAPPPQQGWRGILTAEDQRRLDQLPQTWRSALAAVPTRFRRQVAGEGVLLQPGAARKHAETPPGSYRCRLVRIGAPAPREPAVRTYPDFFCYIGVDDGDELSFTKQTGTELPGGWLHRDDDRRMVMSGAKQRAPGDNSLAYGANPERDLVGIVERIGPFRWRLVLPWREDRPGLDVYELTPVPVDEQAPEPASSDAAAADRSSSAADITVTGRRRGRG